MVRPIGDRFQLIAGERRWRAAQRAGLTKASAIVRQVSDELALEMTLVENIQREDLNPIEAARAFERLMAEFQLTQESVAERTGKDRATVANAVRLLKLEPIMQDWIEEGKLSAGHGRVLAVGVLNYACVMRSEARGGLTVRQIERLASATPAAEKKPKSTLTQTFAKRWMNCNAILALKFCCVSAPNYGPANWYWNIMKTRN